jgi:hypothetical protein
MVFVWTRQLLCKTLGIQKKLYGSKGVLRSSAEAWVDTRRTIGIQTVNSSRTVRVWRARSCYDYTQTGSKIRLHSILPFRGMMSELPFLMRC